MFKNEANLEIILENKRIVDSIYKLVLFLDKKCSSLEIDFGDEYRQTMHLFIQSIVEYGKESYNCMKRGDFYALSMLTRVIVENYTILVTIGNHCDEELYKYRTIWSYANTAEKYIKGSKNCNRITMLLMDCIEESGFSAELINDKNFLSD